MSAYQGDFAAIVASVTAKLRLESADADQVKEAVNLAYQEAVQATGCLQTSGVATLTEDVASYDLPASVAWIKLLTISYADGSFSDPLQQVPLQGLLEQRRATVASSDQVVVPIYSLAGQNQIELWPTPGAGQSMTLWYVYLPDELTADGDEPAILEPYGSKLLEYGALVELARFKKDPLLGDLEAAYQVWLARFQVWLNRREGQSGATIRVRGATKRGVRVADRSADVGW